MNSTFKEIPYYMISREERNLAAIFYHLLLIEGNLKVFLDYIQFNYQPEINDKTAIYYEYAYLRDYWKNIERSHRKNIDRNKEKRDFILQHLQLKEEVKLKNMKNHDFNSYFGAVAEGKISDKVIQSPSNWSISKFDNNIIKDKEELLRASKFKWAFNIKPDIVIQFGENRAVCIECKLESKESKYPTQDRDKKILGSSFPQTEIQRYLMKNTLGLETVFVFLSKKDVRPPNDYKHVSWGDIFKLFKDGNSYPFINKWIGRYIN